jgi:hypothetical protein
MGLSARALVHFFVLELLLVGLLALIGQVPWWLWFVASGLLFAALWAYDHQVQLSVLARRARPAQMVVTILVGAMLCILGGGALTLALLKASPDETKSLTPATSSFGQSLLIIVATKTEKQYGPLRVALSILNAGKLPTTKANASIDIKVLDKDIADASAVEEWFADRANKTSGVLTGPLTGFTLIPGQMIELSLWHTGVTKEVHDAFMLREKFIYVLFAIDYVDRATPPGKRMITEFAMRPANPLSG